MSIWKKSKWNTQLYQVKIPLFKKLSRVVITWGKFCTSLPPSSFQHGLCIFLCSYRTHLLESYDLYWRFWKLINWSYLFACLFATLLFKIVLCIFVSPQVQRSSVDICWVECRYCVRFGSTNTKNWMQIPYAPLRGRYSI